MVATAGTTFRIAEAVELAVPQQQIDKRTRVCITHDDAEQTNQLNPQNAAIQLASR